jgi:hypothetical protein
MTATRPRPGRTQARANDHSAVWKAMTWWRDNANHNCQAEHVQWNHIWTQSNARDDALLEALKIADYFARNGLIDRLAAGMTPAAAKQSNRRYTDAERLIVYLHHIDLPDALAWVQDYPADREAPLTDEELREVIRTVLPTIGV